MNKCIILSSSPNTNVDFCKNEIKKDDYIICADGGYNIAKKINIIPNLLIGDFDSYKGEMPEVSKIIRLPQEKDDTDTMYCVKEALKRGYGNIAILGGLGGRLDHTLANVSALQYIYNNGGKGVLKDVNSTINYCSTGNFHIFNQRDKTVSVFPYGCEKVNVTHHGFKYELNCQDICSSFPLGISNVTTTDESTITIHSGNAIIIVNY